MTPDARSLLASLTDEEAEAVAELVKWAAAQVYLTTPAARRAIAKLRGEKP